MTSGLVVKTSLKNRIKLSFSDEYLNWPQYAQNASLNKNGSKKKADKGTYKRHVQDNGGYSFYN